MNRAAGESSIFGRADCLGGIEYLHATYRTHTFDWHAHEEYVVAIVDAGADLISCRGASHVATAGTILTLNPGEPHDGHGADSHGWKYRVLYPSRIAFGNALDSEQAAPSFRDVVWRHPGTWHELSVLHDALKAPDCALSLQSAAVSTLSQLAEMGGAKGARKGPADSPRLRQAFEILSERFTESISLDTISAEVGLHANYLITAFRQRYGMTPARFLRSRRLAAAKLLLRRGEPLAHIAIDAGFADQAHFSRCFAKAYGVSPGVYRDLYSARV